MIKDFIEKYSIQVAVFIFAILSSFIVFKTGKIFGLDSLYHVKHAFIYAQNGILNTSLPHVSASVIGELGADIWYGFHILLIPFTYISNLLTGTQVATIVLATISLIAFVHGLKTLNIKYPLFWSIVLLLSSADFLFRIFMVRPHIVSLFLSFLLFIYLIKNKPLHIGVISALISFVHIALSWVPILILIITTATSYITEKKLHLKNTLATIIGLVIGVLLHPNLINTLKISYTQIIELFIIKGQEIPMQFGRELNVLTIGDIILQYIPLGVYLLFISVIIFSIYINGGLKDISLQNKKTLIASTTLTVIFIILAFISARRSTDFLSVFSILSSASLLTALFEVEVFRKIIKPQSFYYISAIFLLFMAINSFLVFNQFINNTVTPDKFKEAVTWLEENTKEGDIVFNSYWDNFPSLFFWNSHNYYIAGMDPIFQYSFSEDLYWKAYFIAYTGQPITCGQIKCTEDDIEDIATVLHRDFNAKYIFVEHRRSHNLFTGIEQNEIEGFKKVFSNDTESIYEILPQT